MNQKEIMALDNQKLVAAFYWIAVKATNETNSRRGMTKKTEKQEEWLIAEMCKRFGLDAAALDKEINP
jgi:hypothetical protein